MIEPKEWRVAWKGKDGKKNHAIWYDVKEVVEAHVKELNKKHPKILHWCEPRRI